MIGSIFEERVSGNNVPDPIFGWAQFHQESNINRGRFSRNYTEKQGKKLTPMKMIRAQLKRKAK